MTSAHKPDKKPIETYEHKDKQRLNNPPVGLVTPETDREEGSRSYSHDPHLDPQLVWAGKAEHTSFLVPTVSLHVHERIDPRSNHLCSQFRQDRITIAPKYRHDLVASKRFDH